MSLGCSWRHPEPGETLPHFCIHKQVSLLINDKKTVLWRGESVHKQQTFILTILLFSVHVQYWTFELCLVGFPHQNKHCHVHSPSLSQCTSFLRHFCVIHKPWITLSPPPFSQRMAYRLMKRRRSTSCRKTTESCSRTNCRALACWDV